MAELNISLTNIGFTRVVNIIADLRLTGHVYVVQDELAGKLSFDQGRMVSAAFDAEYGLSALELIFLMMPDAVCTFNAEMPASEQNIDLAREGLEAYLNELNLRRPHLAAAVPSLTAVPQMIPPHEVPEADETVALPRGALTTLQMIDGRRTVRAISEKLGLARTISDLAMLVDRGLISVVAQASEPTAAFEQTTPPARYALHRAPESRGVLSDTRVTLVSSTEPPVDVLCGQAMPTRPDHSDVIVEHPPAGLVTAHRVQVPSAKILRPGRGARGLVAGEVGRRLLRPSVPRALKAVAFVVCLIILLISLSKTFGEVTVGGSQLYAPFEEGIRSLRSHTNGSSDDPVRPQSRPAPGAADAVSGSVVAGPGSILRTVLDERFASNVRHWPINQDATGSIADGTYRLFARRPGQFTAIGAPLTEQFHDVVVTGSFRKIGGPAGGAYGLILRDQGPGPRDGLNQTGRFYVLGVSDQGVAIRRREGDNWVDLAAWTPSQAVDPNSATNQLSALAIGQQLALMVNGTVVATATDYALSEGAVGIFISGDLNEVALDQFIVEVPTY